MSKNSRRNRRRKAGKKGKNPKRLGGDKLRLWQDRLAASDTYWDPELRQMDHREELYNGDDTIKSLVPGDTKPDGNPKKSSHVRNIVFELVESQISSSIPQPKVTPRRKKDERLAAKIEHFLRNELDRMPFEEMNDMAERTVPMQGGVGWQVEWDNTQRTHMSVGETDVHVIHPKQFAPQPGIYTGIKDMDWFIVKQPTTKENVRRRYGICVETEGESEPDIRSTGAEDTAEDAVTLYVGYERSESGINRFVWLNDTVLEDLENYQARRQSVCSKCGRVQPLPGQIIQNQFRLDAQVENSAVLEIEKQVAAQMLADRIRASMLEPDCTAMDALQVETEEVPGEAYDGGPCPWCGSKEFADQEMEHEQVFLPIRTAEGVEIPGAQVSLSEAGEPVVKPTMIPFYKPDVYPFVLQKSVSVYGKLLGSSDVDIIEDQQYTINRMWQKAIDKTVKSGSVITMPQTASITASPEEGRVVRLKDVKDKSLIGVYDLEGDLSNASLLMEQAYQESRQIIGITDSFQGRQDPTATSGKAKEYAAAQASGRLESKRMMKNAAYAQLFELMFKTWLAYSDEPRSISYKDFKGETQYEEISRYDFLEQDEDGQYYWNDQFLFSCDTSAPLASNREAMWAETRNNFASGAFGDPGLTETQILFWGMMERLHYPNAGEIKKFLEDKQTREQAAMVPTIPGGGQAALPSGDSTVPAQMTGGEAPTMAVQQLAASLPLLGEGGRA